MIFTAWAPVGPGTPSLGKPSPRVLHKTPPTTQNVLCSVVGSYPSESSATLLNNIYINQYLRVTK